MLKIWLNRAFRAFGIAQARTLQISANVGTLLPNAASSISENLEV